MQTALNVVGVLMIVATMLPVLRADAWWIRVFDFPRLQIAVVAAACLAGFVADGRIAIDAQGAVAGLLALCLVYQVYMIFPYTRLSRKQVQASERRGGGTFDAVFANVLQTNREAGRLVEIVRRADPDVFLAIETDAWWEEQLRVLEPSYPYRVHQPQENTYGMILYSRLELVDPEVRFLVQDDIPSIHARVVLASGDEVELYCLHPRPPFLTEATESTGRDAELLVAGKQIRRKRVPAIAMGDLNDVAWSRTNYLFQDISGLLDPRIGRGFFNTFHAKVPFLRFPLDHVFHSDHFRLIDLRRLPAFGSDHFPVFISLSYEPDATAEHEQLRPDAEEVREAEEKIEDAVSDERARSR